MDLNHRRKGQSFESYSARRKTYNREWRGRTSNVRFGDGEFAISLTPY